MRREELEALRQQSSDGIKGFMNGLEEVRQEMAKAKNPTVEEEHEALLAMNTFQTGITAIAAMACWNELQYQNDLTLERRQP